MTFRDIIKLWPSLTDFAREVGVTLDCAKSWRHRDSIQSAHYPSIVAAAQRRGLVCVTNDLLVSAAARNATKPKSRSKKNARRDLSLAA